MQYDVEHEKFALFDYSRHISSLSDFVLTRSGLIIGVEHPIFCASPDGIVLCSCCDGCVEAKCPANSKESDNIDVKYLRKVGDGYKLLRNHAYY